MKVPIPQADVFDFRNKWHLVRPHLDHPKVRRALARGMNKLLVQERERLIEEGHHPSWVRKATFDHENGPWFYTPTNYWKQRARIQIELAMDRGEFRCRCANPADLSVDERAHYDEFLAQFFPQPDTYYWYQCFRACHWLAPWLKELGKQVFPDLRWRIMKGEEHSLAYGIKGSEQMIIFDILNFDQMSALGLLEFAARRGRNEEEVTNSNRLCLNETKSPNQKSPNEIGTTAFAE